MKNMEMMKILILDDEQQFTEELSGFFIETSFEVFEANTIVDGYAILRNHEIDILILDIRLPGMNGLDVLKDVKEKYPEMEVIMISAHGDMDTVIKAMRLGAFEYLRKPFRFVEIQMAIERTKKYVHLNRKLKRVEEKNSLISKGLEAKIDRQFIGVSHQVMEVLEQAKTAAKYSEANVLITGESGTGKENIARVIHFLSPRKEYILCAVNSSAITDTLLESEFFGHKKGSFTGAIADKMGFFEVCNQGTLFLDEIADMPFNLQAKILRATEEKVITRVGDTKPIHTDFRIISATNHDIQKRVEEKTFRLDLFHRLNTLHIHIPALRERKDDIKPLLTHFVDHFSTKFNKHNLQISKEVFDNLLHYDFPGNVRELRNMTERAVILCKGNVLSIHDFLVHVVPKKLVLQQQDNDVDLKKNEIKIIKKTLSDCNYNQKQTADILGITRDALIRRMKKYDIFIQKGEA